VKVVMAVLYKYKHSLFISFLICFFFFVFFYLLAVLDSVHTHRRCAGGIPWPTAVA
jgi:hypothetical protein